MFDRSVIFLTCWKLLFLLLLPPPGLGVEGGALPLTTDNIDQVIADHQLVLVNFYADWCR
jgi:hypothetical protein